MKPERVQLDRLDSQQKRELLERLLRAKAAQTFPLSFGQERLWLLERLDQGARGHIMSAALRLTGSLAAAALRAAQNEIVRRHSVLRAVFLDENGTPRQRFVNQLTLDLPVLDAQPVDPSERARWVQDRADEIANRPFDLERGPLLRSALLRLGPDERIWILAAHHIVFDGWSVGVFVREIAALYPAMLRGEAPDLPKLKLQYAEFAAWQREWATKERLAPQIAYWRERLNGAPAAIELPFDRKRPAQRSDVGGVVHFTVPAATSQALEAIARSAGATLYMTLLAGFAALLGRYSGQEDLVIGSPVANRTRSETEPLIGFFVNTLPLRIDLSGEPTFRELLQRVKSVALGAFRNQDPPFEKLVEELRPERDLSRNPLFQVMFGLRNIQTEFELAGLHAAPFPLERRASQFDLTLLMKQLGDAMEGAFEYSAELFESPTVERLARHLTAFLDELVRRPDRPIHEAPLLPSAERRQLLARLRGQTDAAPRPQVHRAFETAVRRRPAATAVWSEEEALSYAELNQRANRIAAELRRRGCGAESVVGLFLERSPAMIATLLGVLKAGAAYLPLDPQYPADRLRFMAADAGARLLITQSALAGQAPPAPAAPLLVDGMPSEPAGDVAGETPPASLAYVIYTSGSTGSPKGVMVSHGALANFCTAAREAYPIRATDRVLQFASLSFDAAAEEIFPALAAGATLVLRSETAIETPARFLAACDDWGVTVLDLPTSYWTQIAKEIGSGRRELPSSLRLVIIGGEAAPVDAVARWRERTSERRLPLLNTYGPTETTVVATFCDLSSGIGDAGREVPIGRPLPNTACYVLDRRLEPVPPGAQGELYAAGDGLARGYLARPGLTADRFRPDSFGAPGGRMYRTGDLVRLRADGHLEFLGRQDAQLKVRGFRIEPGEIEAALLAHPDLSEAVVTAQSSGPAGRLSAYVVARPGASADTDRLRRWLKERLPHYMIPADILPLAGLPRLPSGKVDRQRLPVVDETRQSPIADPRNAAEEQLAAIWRDVLGVSRVGIRDNFFELGGDSIMSIQVASRASQRGWKIRSRDLFQNQTIAELAAVAVESDREEGPAEPDDPMAPAPLTPIQRWFFSRRLPNPSHFNQTVLLQLAAGVDESSLCDAVDAVLARHPALRSRFRRGDNGWEQVVDEVAPTIERIVFEPSSPERMRAAIEEAADRAQRRLDLLNGPLLRCLLLLPPGEPPRLLLTAHHLVIDAVSWRTLLEEIADVYAGRQPPPPTSAFSAWARRLVRFAATLDEAAAAPWLQTPQRIPALRTDFEAAPAENTVESSEQVAVELETEETATLLRQTLRSYDARIDEILLAALAVAFVRWSGAAGLLVDLEHHGRDDPFERMDFSRTVGWFTAIYPVWLEADREDPEAALGQVKARLRAAPPAATYGALRYLRPDESLSGRLGALPQPEVAFNYLGQLDSVVRPPFAGPAPEHVGAPHDPSEPRSHLLEINSLIRDGRLRLEWTFSRRAHRRETALALASEFLAILRKYLTSSSRPSAPSNPPASGLRRRELDKLRKRLGTRGLANQRST